jgi:restriction endonuclease S subunit
MADFPIWLRGLQRSRTPTFAAIRAERDSIFSSTVDVDVENSQPVTTSKASFRPSSTFDAHSQLNHVDEIWYNPDPDQMAETLKVLMMAQGSFRQVPVEYNYCILHILEAYQDMRRQLTKRDEEIQAIRQTYESKVENYEREILRWKKERNVDEITTKGPDVVRTTRSRKPNLVGAPRSTASEETAWGIDGHDEYPNHECNIDKPSQISNNCAHKVRSTVSVCLLIT